MRFLAKDSAVYGMAAAISRFATLLTFPIIVRHLAVSDYGVFDILQVFGGFLTVFLIFGQDSGVARYFFDHDDLETRRELISQSFLIRILVLAAALPLIWLLAGKALGLLGIDPSFRSAFGILLLQAPCLVFLNFAVVLLRVTFSRNRFIFLSIGFSFTQAACWLVAILVYDASVSGILLSGLLAAAIFAAIGLYFIRGWLKPTLRLDFVVQMLPYSLPYGSISALRAIVPLMERALVALLLAADALGLYAAGAKITMLYALFAFAFQSAWEPFALSIGKRPDAAATYNLVLKVFVVIS
ncbi:MAG TPA: oligosaccharide flippase family protein, partial [Tabrizicola sp.]|nr:oligosaccharide flippase family protein [Tabrizicola sp.]